MYRNLAPASREQYESTLKTVGSFSSLHGLPRIIWNGGATPYIDSTIAKTAYCYYFNGKDVEDDGGAIDLCIKTLGVKISSVLNRLEGIYILIDRFDKQAPLINKQLRKNVVKEIANLRNTSIYLTRNRYGLTSMIDHILIRDVGKVHIYEELIEPININTINNIQFNRNNTAILFQDDSHEYLVDLTQCFLYKKINCNIPLKTLQLNILQNPFEAIPKIKPPKSALCYNNIEDERLKPSVILPLFSDRTGDVPEKSGLNQWHAEGRIRDVDEIYIPIPAWIHQRFPGFFPDRDEVFTLITENPSQKSFQVKVCQDNSKALMSNPNKALGHWLLRDIMEIPLGYVMTRSDLRQLNVDSVEIIKLDDQLFKIKLKSYGSYDKFKENINRIK